MSSSKKEKDFIRGRAGLHSIASSSVKKKVTAEQPKDQLFEVRKRKSDSSLNVTKAKKRAKRSKNKNEDLLEDDDKVVIESMSLSRLPEGIVIYSCIKEISDFELKLSVCGGIVATVSITDISSPYTSLLQSFAQNDSPLSDDIEVLKPNGMFKIGQHFPIRIISKSKRTEGFRGVEVKGSLNPKDIYQDVKASSLLRVPQMPIIGAVASIEDHGFVMDVGFENIKAFLPKDKAMTAIKAIKGRNSLSVGQLVLCSIESVLSERSIRLTTDLKFLSDFKLKSDNEVDLSCLTPGISVRATVLNVTEKGLVVYILNGLKGFVTRHHLRNDWELPKNLYKIGDKVEGIILYRHPITKQIALSLKPMRHPKAITNLIDSVKVGRLYENAVMMGRDHTGNCVFKLPDGLKAICSRKQLFDKHLDDAEFENALAIGSSHKCRVKSINIMDSLIVVTLKKSALDFPFVSDNDLKIGSLFRGKVKKVMADGAIIQIAFGVNGFVPNIHMSETGRLKNREQLFPKGKVVKCRIYRIDKSCSPIKVNLTCKKSLLNPKLNLLSSYEDAKPGFQTDGVVVLIQNRGILVEFFNQVKGFIPLKFLSTYRIENPENIFTIGQIVRCTIISSDIEREKIICSLIKIKDKRLNKENKNLQIGLILRKLKISKKTDNGFELTNEANDVRFFLPFGHLSDDIEATKLLSQALTVGTNVDEVMVFNRKASLVIVTRKASFILATKNNQLVSSLDQLEPNMVIPVVIDGFASYGIFVELPANIKGLVPKRFMTDGPIDEPKNLGFELKQTVFARFIEFEEQSSENNSETSKKKLTFSLKLSHVWDRQEKPFEDRVTMFEHYLKDMNLGLSRLSKSEDSVDQKLSKFRIGSIAFFSVTSIENCPIICEVRLENDKRENCVKGMGLVASPEIELRVGLSGIAVIAEIDFNNKWVVVLINPKLAKQVKNSIKINAISNAKCDQTVKSTAIHINNKYVLMTMTGHVPGLIALVPTRRHLNDRNGIAHLFSLNEAYHVVIKSVSHSSVIAVLKSHTDDDNSKKSNKVKQKLDDKSNNERNDDFESSEKENESNRIEKTATYVSNAKKKEKNKDNSINRNTKDLQNNNNSETKLSESLGNEIQILKVEKPFVWAEEDSDSEFNEDYNDSESDSNESDSQTKIKKTRKERNEEVRHREEELRKREAALMDPNRPPETVEDLERSVLSSPNSSMVWLKYMAFHLEQEEVAKAREVAERAIKTISFREERERLNVWVAFLNLENMYGTDQTLNQVFERALQYNEPVVIYRHLASIYWQSNKEELAEQLFHTMLKKFKQNKNVWIDFGMFYMQHKRLDSARKLLQRSLTCLEKKDHIDVISKFAQLECKYGEVEQAKSLFERVLTNFPKRVDLWSVYIDMMLKYGLKDNSEETEDWVRNIFERVITFKLSAKRMKFIFKRYIDFEKQFNNFERIERIRQKAIEYVEGSQPLS